MDDRIGKDAKAKTLVAAALDGTLTDAQAAELAALDPSIQKLAWLVAAQRIAEQNARIARLEGRVLVAGAGAPNTPSGQKPPYVKPPAPKRKARPGAKVGHVGTRRLAPPQIDRREEHRAEVCPDCGGELQRCKRVRMRTVEDILADLRTEVTEHTVHRDYCPSCKKHVEPTVPDALPNATIGHNLVALTQAILMSIYRTLKLRGQDPVQTLAATVRTCTATGHLPPLPIQFVADG